MWEATRTNMEQTLLHVLKRNQQVYPWVSYALQKVKDADHKAIHGHHRPSMRPSFVGLDIWRMQIVRCAFFSLGAGFLGGGQWQYKLRRRFREATDLFFPWLLQLRSFLVLCV